MNTTELTAAIDAEIARLEEAKRLLGGVSTKRSATTPGRKAKAAKRTMSAEGRARITVAQKARWAKAKKAAFLG